MTDFGDFNSSSDPTADFLARERAALGQDADLFAFDAPETTGVPAIQADEPSQALAVTSNGDHGFDASFPKAEELETSQAFTRAMLPDEEPEVVRQWREKQREQIDKRDEDEEEKKQAAIIKAREEIDRFYEEYNEKKQKAIEQNRAREEAYQQEREQVSSSANVWERVVREFDVNSNNAKQQSRDVSRMKQIMLDLRKSDNAPGTIVQA
ncbi:clathrin light chain [Gongronella butleri]|nr:clathrin light chain [Gongronella butleri]